MDEQDRQELERLKERAKLLQTRLSELDKLNCDLALLSQKIVTFEEGLKSKTAVELSRTELPATTAPVPTIVSEVPTTPLAQSNSVPVVSPVEEAATRPRAHTPPPLPPVIETLPAAPAFAQSAELPVEEQRIAMANAGVPPDESPPSPIPAKKSSFELRLGTFWLVRIGIVMLLTGLVFLANLAYKNWVVSMGPGGKVTLLYVASAALVGVGVWLHRKQDALKNYAQVLIAGGLAAGYFTTYAAHHIPILQVIHSAVLDGVLLLGWAGFTVWLADRIKSEVLALFAIGLGYYTGIITDVGLFTLYSNLVLTAAAIWFLIRNRWATLSFVSLIATYVGYGFWRFYHHGEWRWATPEDDLWRGNYFLICYWIIFTTAVFLSRHEQLTGTKRVGFLSLNNGALFTAFLLTMLQVRQGGFWKFSLAYGILLIGMAALARRFLTEGKLTCNAYLTQGLVLVTLGFITYFTGTKLALVLGVESVLLTVLSQQMGNRVLKIGSYICAMLATGWAVHALKPFDNSGLIVGASIGALMLFNASWGRWRQPEATPASTFWQQEFFTPLALLLWFLATWNNCTAEWRALALAAESVVFLVASRPLRNRILGYGAYPFAALSVTGAVKALLAQYDAVPLAQREGLFQSVMVGALMIFNALWECRQSRSRIEKLFQPPALFYVPLALIIWLATTWVFTPPQYLAPVLAFEALVFTIAYYPLRLAELTLFGQIFLAIAQWQCGGILMEKNLSLPWWNPALVIAITVAISHWWQRQKTLVCQVELKQFCQGIYALATVGVLFLWLMPHFSAPAWLALTSVLAVGVTIYATLMRSWMLAACGQLFLLASVYEFLHQLYFTRTTQKPEWIFAVVPIVLVAGLSIAALKWLKIYPAAKPQTPNTINTLAMVYRGAAVLLALSWTFEYIPVRERFWSLALTGGVLFLWNCWKPSRQVLIESAVFTLVGFVQLWTQVGVPEMLVHWPNVLAILFLLAQQQIAKRTNARLPEAVHTSMILLGGCSLWLFVSSLVRHESGGFGFYLTAAWAGLALAIFTTGFILRERFYRWLGLAILACALGRVVFLDVWRLETIYRILSFMALGIVLLVLGFIYNKYQEKLKEWL